MRDRYNLNLLPGMSEDGLEYGELQHTCGQEWWDRTMLTWRLCLPDDVDLNNVASIPGMGIPEQLKAAMEQEHSSKSQASVRDLKNAPPTHPAGLQAQTQTFLIRKAHQKAEKCLCCEDKHKNLALALRGLEG